MRGASATCGLAPVFIVTEETTQGGCWFAKRHVAPLAGLRSAMNPTFVLAYAMTAVCVNGSIPMENGNGGGVGGVVGALVGMSELRSIVATGVVDGVWPTAGMGNNSSVRSA